MPGSVISAPYGTGNSVRSINGSVRSNAGGTSCCCGTCRFFYRAPACAPIESCVPASGEVYICNDYVCGTNPNPSGFAGQIQNGTVIRFNGSCYRVDTGQKYCIDPNPLHNPRNCQPMPPNAVIVTGADDCWTNCQPPHCYISGYYKLSKCSCSGGTIPEPGYYVKCETFQAALLIASCPVWTIPGGICAYVAPNTTPIPLPLGAFEMTGTGVADGCCRCCGGATPDCCICTSPSVLTIANGSCNAAQITTGNPVCQVWDRASASIQYCGWSKVSFMGVGGIPYDQQIACYQKVGPYSVRETVTQFTGEPGGQNISCSGGCGGSAVGVVAGSSSTVYTSGPCSTGHTAFDIPAIIFGLGGGTPPNCCNIGQELRTCRTWQLQSSTNGMPCGGASVSCFFNASITSAAGHCGDDPCSGGAFRAGPSGLVVPDTQIVMGCSGCGGAKGEAV